MSYYIDEDLFSLSLLQERLQNTDLIPSHELLLIDLTKNISALQSLNITSVRQLRKQLKTSKSLKSFADRTGIDGEYLVLLRRVVNGFFPKPKKLKELNWLADDDILRLDEVGIKNTRQLYDAMNSDAGDLAKVTNIKASHLNQFLMHADLCRIQWVSPLFARMLIESGYTSAEMVAQVKPQQIYEAVSKLNQKEKYFTGNIGLRDIKRLVVAASYVI